MSDSYLTLVPSYFTGLDPARQRAYVSVTLDLATDVKGPARLALWDDLMRHLARSGVWAPAEESRDIAAWLDKVDARGYAPRIISSLVAARPLGIGGLALPARMSLAGELLSLAGGFPVRLRALELLDFVGAGVFTPSVPPAAIAAIARRPAPWTADPAEAAAIAALARSALAVESWPGNRSARWLAERPGLAALL